MVPSSVTRQQRSRSPPQHKKPKRKRQQSLEDQRKRNNAKSATKEPGSAAWPRQKNSKRKHQLSHTGQRKRNNAKSTTKEVRETHPVLAKVVTAHLNNESLKRKKERKSAVKLVYKIIKEQSEDIGGDGSGGPIYGELTKVYMQKIINYLKANCGLSKLSNWIDIGCGLGKPSMHVAQDPGVQFSFGIEIEKLRANLGLVNLYYMMEAARRDESIGFKCMLQHGNVSDAKSLNPFTHVYMHDVA